MTSNDAVSLPTEGPYVTIRETHSGVVLLVGDRAYKLKKPVDLGFLDFTSSEARRRDALREVKLNSRLAPDVYLGVAELDDPTAPCRESIVVMRRMPDQRRLSTLIRNGVVVDDDLRHLAHQLAAFHSRSEHGPDITVEGGRERLAARWKDSFDQVRTFHGSIVDAVAAREVERLCLRFLDGRADLFDRRTDDGRIVDGHGDLLADDIFCLPDGPRALDCLEFDDRLRYVDQIDDAAFLAMDLERLGAPKTAERFMAWYTDFAGDTVPPSLIHHYVAYRAFVRAKVACLRYQQGDAAAGCEADRYLASTLSHLKRSAVTLVLVGGLPGTGKSTLAGGLADRLGMVLLSSDRVRKELAHRDPRSSAASSYGAGIYTRAWTHKTYEELLDRARRLLSLGESVVIDASWGNGDQRDRARSLARDTHSDLVEIRCEAPVDVAAARMQDRRCESDADKTIAAAMRSAAHPWPEATVIDTIQSTKDAVKGAADLVRPDADTPVWRRRSLMAPD
jgi:aminoglycoside phosphotransferase family enzyme/predicted kinase